jgi:hypothetical protein
MGKIMRLIRLRKPRKTKSTAAPLDLRTPSGRILPY